MNDSFGISIYDVINELRSGIAMGKYPPVNNAKLDMFAEAAENVFQDADIEEISSSVDPSGSVSISVITDNIIVHQADKEAFCDMASYADSVHIQWKSAETFSVTFTFCAKGGLANK